MSNQKIKILTAKIGLDDHYKGIILVNQALRDAGMEVVYLGTGQRIDGVVTAAIQEDADVIGLSFLNASHMPIMEEFMSRMQERGLEHLMVIAGGNMPFEDIPKLKEMGVSEVFISGSKLNDIVCYVSENTGK